jgi:Lrp/AsnC family transcriptional regulator for asnA, asnC and gidA
MDQMDRNIIAAMGRNARETNKSLGDKMGCSEETVRRRLKRLIDEGAMAVVAIPNMVMLGFGTKALVGVNVEPSLVESVAAHLSAVESVEWVTVTTGEFDIVIQVVVTDTDELYRVVKQEIGSIVGIIALHVLVAMDSPKVQYLGHTNGKNPA